LKVGSGKLTQGVIMMNIVELANKVLDEAISAGASDIHLEPQAKGMQIRFRVDGDLQQKFALERKEAEALMVRYKVKAALDIAVTRMPQDGKLKYHFAERYIDLRFSTLPSILGEKLVIRILDQATGLLSLPKLLLPEKISKELLSSITGARGLFLVVGPTGSGKTTTLYALLQYLNNSKKNIITIEDPVEYQIPGITQVQVNQKAGLSFATGLRSILRQDPDIIFVGEIRDKETAEICLRAALTGHLVLGTLHTRDSLEAVIRLQEMGLPPFLISTALRGILAQRLVGLLCSKCQGEGCSFCSNKGVKGREALFEYLPVKGKIEETINKRVSYNQLQETASLNDWYHFKRSVSDKRKKKNIYLPDLYEFTKEAE
jgi:type II secretory ATPase GspE/PulE/Tfp pilus assembly ATPase PilB-like protein